MTKNKTMRKSLSLVACLSLMCALLLACSGCGNKEKDALLGTWQTTIDLTDMINDEMAAGLDDDEMLQYLTVEKFTMDLTLVFNEDDSYSLSADEAAMSQQLDTIIESFKGGMTRYIEDMIAAEGVDMTVDDFFAQLGMDMDTLMDQAFDKEDLMSAADAMESKGTFEAKGGVLYLTDEEGTGLESYKLEDGKLTLTGEGVEDATMKDLYPMVFTKK